MKKIIIFSALVLTVVSLSACTTKTTNSTTVDSQSEQSTQKSTSPSSTSSATKTDKPVATFAPTSDDDVKKIDKDFDSVKTTDFDDKAIDDIAK